MRDWILACLSALVLVTVSFIFGHHKGRGKGYEQAIEQTQTTTCDRIQSKVFGDITICLEGTQKEIHDLIQHGNIRILCLE